MTAPRRVLPLLLLSAGVLAGCSATPGVAPQTTALQTTAPQTSAPASTAAPAPSTSATTTEARAYGCGTVPAASGLTLQVMETTTSTLSCGQATDLVTRFQRAIAGRQPAGSGRPVSETVDGWLCVSGPPASQGGTTCSRGDDTVFARVTEAE
ncbi:hypothetical protein [Amycolatopsis methanolica]|uniref:Secreted protein n=1 Tax=Amycolatopsis methanolica 239 TaxID=1068978 RepID=A0A076MQD3_AMYME|nr:hypothetical protein [Amycolatopsis methanolica]AIJ23088.1 hypothetical protein AMETH_2996 [Amycolatopsis methanolica 239]